MHLPLWDVWVRHLLPLLTALLNLHLDVPGVDGWIYLRLVAVRVRASVDGDLGFVLLDLGSRVYMAMLIFMAGMRMEAPVLWDRFYSLLWLLFACGGIDSRGF